MRAARLTDDQVAAVLALADRLVAGRRVEQHGRPGHRLQRRRGNRHPEVLADLDTHDNAATRAGRPLAARASKSRSTPKGTRPAGQLDLGGQVCPWPGWNQRSS